MEFFFLTLGVILITVGMMFTLGKLTTKRAVERAERINDGWDKLYCKFINDGWIPPETSKWFNTYIKMRVGDNK
jgi:hypothetical protein